MSRRMAVGVAWALIVLALLAAAPVLAERWRQEQANRTVDLVLDYESLRALTLQTGQPMATLLQGLRVLDSETEAGIHSLAVWEMTLADLELEGLAAVLEGRDLLSQLASTGPGNRFLARLRAEGRLVADHTYVLPLAAELGPRLFETLALRLGRERVQWYPPERDEQGYAGAIRLQATPTMLRRLGAGFNGASLDLARQAQMRPVFRPWNAPAVSAELVQQTFADLRSLAPEAGSIMFAGNEVLGYRPDQPALLQQTAAEIDRSGYVLDLIEHAEQRAFIIQRGQEEVAAAIGYRVARVYSIGQAEIDRFRPEITVEKWLRSVAERNIRVLYLRPFLTWQDPGETLIETNQKYFRRLVQGLQEAGYRIGVPDTFDPVQVSFWQRLLMALGVVGAGAVWLAAVWPVQPGTLLLVQGLGVALAAAGLYVAPRTGADLLALAAAILFPTLGMTLLLQRWRTSAAQDWMPEREAEQRPAAAVQAGAVQAGAGALLQEGLIAFALLGGLALAGGLLVAAMLGDITYMLEFRYFRGVKVMLALPLLAALVAYMVMGREGRPGQVARSVVAHGWSLAGAAVRYRHLLLVAAAGVAVFWYIQRSGNFPVVPVPQWELRLRAWLEQTLVARPRFKEFAVGYPALALAVMAVRHRWRLLVLPALLAGGTAAISAVNSFAHLRTPWMLSLLRFVHGIWLGALIGLVAVLVVHWLWRWLGQGARLAWLSAGGEAAAAGVAGGSPTTAEGWAVAVRASDARAQRAAKQPQGSRKGGRDGARGGGEARK